MRHFEVMQHLEITPESVPHSDQRMIVISEADLNRLRRVVADVINAYESAAQQNKKTARYYKNTGLQDAAKGFYKEADWNKEKAKKLAKISSVLKYNVLNTKECVQNFNSGGVSLVDKGSLNLTIQQANAWLAVANLIDQRVQKWYSYGCTGKEAVLNILKQCLPIKK